MRFKYLYITIFIVFVSLLNFHKAEFIKSGTTIICVVRNDTVWIGADSKIVDQFGKFIGIGCKVFSGKNFVFANSGLFGYGKYNIPNIAYRSIGEYFTINDLWLFKRYAIKILYEIGENMSTRKIYKAGQSEEVHFSTIFATNTNGNTNIFFDTYELEVGCCNRGSVYAIVKVDSVFASGISTNVLTYKAGIYDEIKSMDANRTEDIPIFIKKLITIEINAHPDSVGYPINIIRVTKNKIDWIDKHPPCK